MYILNQGEIDIVNGTILHTCRDVPKVISSIRFFNSAAYTIRLEKFSAALGTTVIVYDINTRARDSIVDPDTYVLEPGDYLTAFATIPGTTFLLQGH